MSTRDEWTARRSRVWEEADRLVRRLGLRVPADLDLDLLAAVLDATVIDDELRGAVGQMIVNERAPHDRRALIRVSTDVRAQTRRRFTIAHELGHFVLRHVPASVGELCGARELEGRSRRIEESEANAFAAALLMPAAWVARWTDHPTASLDDIREMARAFTVAIESAALRLVELTPHPCAVVICRSGRVARVSPSATFPGYVLRGWTPGVESGVVECIAYGKPPRTVRDVPASTWLRDVDRGIDTLIEHTMIMPGTRDVLGLLRVPTANERGK